MLYSGLKTGKIAGWINDHLSRITQVNDLKFASVVLTSGAPMVFSIPELAVDVRELVPKDEYLEPYVTKHILKPGISFMPPDNVTWWETHTRLRWVADELDDGPIPAAVICVRVGRDLPKDLLRKLDTAKLFSFLDKYKWAQALCFMTLLQAHEPEHVYSIASHVFLGMDEQGEAIGLYVQIPDEEVYETTLLASYRADSNVPPQPNDADLLKSVLKEHGLSAVVSVFQALALLNCKNVSSDQHHFQPRKPGSKHKGRGPLAKAVYRTLKLTLPGRQGKSGTISHTDSEATRAFHMVRGHFSVYTEQAKLFGKYTGRYWIPAHTRGSKDVGIISKRYEITKGDA
jgi:hypothetical protein